MNLFSWFLRDKRTIILSQKLSWLSVITTTIVSMLSCVVIMCTAITMSIATNMSSTNMSSIRRKVNITIYRSTSMSRRESIAMSCIYMSCIIVRMRPGWAMCRIIVTMITSTHIILKKTRQEHRADTHSKEIFLSNFSALIHEKTRQFLFDFWKVIF